MPEFPYPYQNNWLLLSFCYEILVTFPYETLGVCFSLCYNNINEYE